MNITDYVHGRCTVERVTIKTSLKVNGGEGGEGKRGEEGLQDSHWLCIPPLPKEQTWIIKLLLTELFEALSPPQKKTQISWFDQNHSLLSVIDLILTGTGIIIVYVVQSVLFTYCQYAFCRSLNWFHILQTKIPPIIMFLST